MNDQPHTHKVVVRKGYTYAVIVEYGDTTEHLDNCFGKVSEWRIRRAVRKVIRRHDRGSVRAGAQQRTLSTIAAEANARLSDAGWGK